MSETVALIRIEAASETVADRIAFYLDGDTRPDFDDDLPESEKPVFEALEFADAPVSVSRPEPTVIDAWFENNEPEAIEEIIKAFYGLGVKNCFVYFADDEECKVYWVYEQGRLKRLYSIEDDPEFDKHLWDLDWDERALSQVVTRFYKML